LPSRRDLLSLAATAALAASGHGCVAHQRGGAQSDSPLIGYVDAHSHIWTPDTARYPLGKWITRDQMSPPSFTAEELLAVAGRSGVDRVVLIQHAPYYGDDNTYLIDSARRYPGRFAVVAIVEQRRPNLREHVRQLKSVGVRGLRIVPNRYADRSMVEDPANWLKAPAMRQLWTVAADEGLVLCPLITADLLPTLPPMLADFPGVTVAIDHFAHARTDAELDALLRLADYPKVHVKVSGFYKFGDAKAPYDDLEPMIRRVLGGFGAQRLLWGSDCPYQLQNGNTYEGSVALIGRGLGGLDRPTRLAILRSNAARLFF
jgi:predicted TIM-barrel fold metal-dependent hydrolase